MADELQYYGNPDTESGLTVVARVYDAAGAQLSTDVPTTEVGVLAIYQGGMPTAAAGQYGVRFFNGAILLGQGCIDWDGTVEVTGATLNTDVDAIAATATANAAAIAALNNLSAADVQAELVAYDAAVPADLSTLATAASITALNDLSAADVQAELVTYDAVVPADLSTLATAASVAAIPTNPLLTTDARLDNLDATISSRLAAAGYTAPNNAAIAANGAAIAALNDISAADVWAAVTRTLTDTTGFELSAAERLAIATQVEQSILNEGDGQQVLNAIVGAIGNTNVDEVALVAAIRADLERAGGAIDLLETEADAATRQAALVAENDATQTAIAALNDPDTAAIADAVWDEVLAGHLAAGTAGEALNTAGLGGVSVADIQLALTNQGYTTARAPNLDNLDAATSTLETEANAAARALADVAEHDATQASLTALNNLSAADVAAELTTYDAPTKAELDTSGATVLAAIAALNDLDAAASQTAAAAALTAYDAPTKAELDTSEATVLAAIASLADLSIADVQTALVNQGYTSARALLLDNADVATSTRQSEADAAARAAADTAAHTATQGALAALPDPDTLWDVLLSNHTVANSTGAALQQILDLEEADETFTNTTAEKRKRGTSTVILTKTVTGTAIPSPITLED